MVNSLYFKDEIKLLPPESPSSGRFEKPHNAIMFLISKSSILRYFFWRVYNFLLRRIGPKTYLGRAYFGAVFDCDLNDFVQRTIFYFGVWEPDITYLIQQRLRKGDAFLDIGANIGYDSLLAASCVGPDGHVIAIEASPRIFPLLKRNLERNRAHCVTALNFAVSDREAKIPIYAGPPDNIGMTTTVATPDAQYIADVDAAPIERRVDPRSLKHVKLIKIDVEGGETPILAHFLETRHLYSDDVEIIVELAQAVSEEDWRRRDKLLSDFRAAGFRCYVAPNEYDVNFYFNWKAPARLVEITSYPRTFVDVLLTRGAIP